MKEKKTLNNKDSIYHKIIAFIIILSIFSFTCTNQKVFGLENNDKKVIYLTFDDGPSFATCNKIMDILKEKEVKATFFVVGCRIDGRENIVKRMYEEGHSIGLHTYTHNYKKIYSDQTVFIKEMEDTAAKIKVITGVDPTIIRFPTGSKKHLDQNFMEKLHAHGYKIYDWNACISDGLNYRTAPDTLYKQAVKTGLNWSTVFLLMHSDENNVNTCKAIPQIIDYYKNLGYEFRVIDNNTPEYHFRVKS